MTCSSEKYHKCITYKKLYKKAFNLSGEMITIEYSNCKNLILRNYRVTFKCWEKSNSVPILMKSSFRPILDFSYNLTVFTD